VRVRVRVRARVRVRVTVRVMVIVRVRVKEGSEREPTYYKLKRGVSYKTLYCRTKQLAANKKRKKQVTLMQTVHSLKCWCT
jgi:hypothetical protein